ncbi:MAG: hypothetical protein KGN16_22935 [Burkholderiales bacterium]|nr:hypothetical protein [Burkholderiales bacterium]
MNLRFSTQFLVAATLATAALGAQARPDVYFSIGVQAGPVWVQSAPVYVPAPPVYMPPAQVVLRPPVWVPPRLVFERPGWRGYDARDDRDAWERERAWRRAEWHRHEGRDGYRGDDRGDDRDHDDHGPRRGFRD